MTNLSDLSDEELLEQWTETGNELARIKDKLKEYSEEHQRRVLLEQAKAKAATLNDEERRALLQDVEPEATESGEQSGTPGGSE